MSYLSDVIDFSLLSLQTRALLVLEADSAAVNNDGYTAWTLAQKRYDETNMMDFKDRQGVLFSLYAVGASGSSTPCDKKGQELDFRKITRQSLQPPRGHPRAARG